MSQPQLEQKDLEEMERYDESQIIEEVRGHVTLPKFFYELKNGTTSISWIGIKALSSYMSKNGMPISIVHIEREETEDSYRYMATARLLSTGEERLGVSEQSKMMKLSDGREVKDPFALQKALSKAQRNALRIFIPESAIEEAYKRWKSGGSVDPKSVTRPSNQDPQPTVQKEEICICGHTKYPHHFSDAKEVICQTCIRTGKEVQHDLKPWR